MDNAIYCRESYNDMQASNRKGGATQHNGGVMSEYLVPFNPSSMFDMKAAEYGYFVTHKDYAALQAENATLDLRLAGAALGLEQQLEDAQKEIAALREQNDSLNAQMQNRDAKIAALKAQLAAQGWQDIKALVNLQAENEWLWFIAHTAPEAYLQQELRKLHSAIDAI